MQANVHASVQLRWIEESEARCVREFALVQRSAAEPYVTILFGDSGRGWFERVRTAIPGLGRGVARQPPQRPIPVEMEIALPVAVGAASLRAAPCRAEATDRRLVTILFTDIVNSTWRAAKMGDRHWRMLLDRHDRATCEQIERFGGQVVKNLGDGFLATFDSPARAVCCAAAITATLAMFGLAVRGGLHTGEVDLKRGDIGGLAVHVAARIAALAQPGEALASKTVRDLVTGSGIVFEDRGVHLLRGVPTEMHLYAYVPVALPLPLPPMSESFA